MHCLGSHASPLICSRNEMYTISFFENKSHFLGSLRIVVTHINLFVTAACSSSPWWQESYRILLGTKLIGALFGRLLQVFAVCYSVLLSGGPCSGLNKVAKTHGALFSTNEPHTTHHFPQNRSTIHIILCRRAL